MTTKNKHLNHHTIISAILMAKSERLEELKRSYKAEILKIEESFENQITLANSTPENKLKKFYKVPLQRFIDKIIENDANPYLKKDFTSKHRVANILKRFRKMNALFTIYDIEKEDTALKRPTIRSLINQLLKAEKIYIKEKGRGQGSITVYGFVGKENSKRLEELESPTDTLSSK